MICAGICELVEVNTESSFCRYTEHRALSYKKSAFDWVYHVSCGAMDSDERNMLLFSFPFFDVAY